MQDHWGKQCQDEAQYSGSSSCRRRMEELRMADLTGQMSKALSGSESESGLGYEFTPHPETKFEPDLDEFDLGWMVDETDPFS